MRGRPALIGSFYSWYLKLMSDMMCSKPLFTGGIRQVMGIDPVYWQEVLPNH